MKEALKFVLKAFGITFVIIFLSNCIALVFQFLNLSNKSNYKIEYNDFKFFINDDVVLNFFTYKYFSFFILTFFLTILWLKKRESKV